MTSPKTIKVALVDSPVNPARAKVDGVTLTRGGSAQSLTKSQHERLAETGVRLRTLTEKE
jgi:hypothetical protein